MNTEKSPKTKSKFTLKEDKTTGEYHIFDFFEEDINFWNKSLCRNMSRVDTVNNIFACESENEAQKLCDKRGKTICMICIAFMYRHPQ